LTDEAYHSLGETTSEETITCALQDPKGRANVIEIVREYPPSAQEAVHQ